MKCDQYWPEDHKPILYGDVQVTMTSVSELKDWTVREFTLLKVTRIEENMPTLLSVLHNMSDYEWCCEVPLC